MPKGPKMKKYSGFETTQPVLSYLSAKLASIWSPVRNVTVLFFTYLLSPPLSVCEKLHKLFSYCFPCKMSFICGLYVNDNLAVLHLSPWLYIVSSDFTNAKSQWGQKSSQLVRKNMKDIRKQKKIPMIIILKKNSFNKMKWNPLFHRASHNPYFLIGAKLK